MKFGIFDHMDRGQDDLGQQYRERLQLIEAYDRGGLYAYHLAEHHGTPLGMSPSPSVFLAAAAQHSERLRLGPLVYTLAEYHPLRLAEEICMLDHLSGGRLEFGLGRGISPIELSFYGLVPEEADLRFRECRDIVLEALTSERLTFHGARYRFDDVPMVMRPVQRPHPPLWYGVSKVSSCEWAAANDVNIVSNGAPDELRTITDAYRTEWSRLGKPLDELPLLGISRHIVVADSEREAVELATRAYQTWVDSLMLLWRQRGVTPPHISYPADPADALSRGYVIAGTASTMRDALLELVPATGITYLLCRFVFGDLPLEAALRSVELFVEEVAPAFEQSTVSQ